MTLVKVIPLVLSSLLLGAHFYRSGNFVLVAIALAVPLLLLTRKRWAVTAVQVALSVGAAEWIRTATSIYAVREALGQPATRMFVILGSVALFTVLSAIPLTRLNLR